MAEKKMNGFNPDLQGSWCFPKNQTEMYSCCISEGARGKYLDMRIWWRSSEYSETHENREVWKPSKKGIAVNTRDAAVFLMEFLRDNMDKITWTSPLAEETAGKSPKAA